MYVRLCETDFSEHYVKNQRTGIIDISIRFILYYVRRENEDVYDAYTKNDLNDKTTWYTIFV